MKKILLLLAALITVNFSSLAATWNKPVPRDYTITGGESFYLYNVGQGKFLAHDAMFLTLGDTPSAIEVTALESGDFKFKFTDAGYAYANIDFVCCDGDDTEANAEWYAEKQTDGTYLIRPSKNDPDHSWAEHPDEWMGYAKESNAISPLVKADAGDISWYAISSADISRFQALFDLEATMTELQGYDYDVTSLLSIYNNVESTQKDIEDAVSSVADVLRDYRIGSATEDNPVDVTSLYMINPSFTEGWVNDGHDVPGWTMMPSNFCGQGTGEVEGTFYTDDKILASWAGGAFGDNKVYQTLTNLRNGKYRLGNYGIWIRHTGEDGDPISGAYIYAKVGDKLFQAPLTDTGWWRGLSELEFECRSGEAEVGIMFEATNVGQCLIYDFRLEYLGEATPASRVKNLISTSNDIISAANVNEKYINTLKADIEKGQTLIAENNDSELESFYSLFLSDTEDAQANAEAYTQLATLISSAEQTITQGETEAIGILSDYLLDNELADKASEYAFDNEQLDEIITKLNILIDEAANSIIKPGQEITYLVVNADFTSSKGWVNTKNENGTGFDNSKKLLNKWWNDWAAEQTIENLPNGTYRLEVQGFQWHSWDWAAAQTQWEAGDGTDPTYDVTTLICLNDVSVHACNVFSCGATDLKEGWDTGSYFVPQNESQAVQLFDEGLYMNVVEAEVTDHKLTILFDCTVDGFWNCFANLHLYYVSSDYTDAVESVTSKSASTGTAAYSLQGTKVNPSTYKGIYIRNGKKFISK